ncbi:hypothetical protein BH10PSE2_BH10PSE2_19410 [soil metagenome]
MGGADETMQALINLITGFIALLAATALAQFGVDLQTPRGSERGTEREVHRTADCRAGHASERLPGAGAPRC